VAWSDGSEDAAVTFFDDEVLFSEGDLVGLTREQARTLHQRRDVQYLREP
jgi:hypothetical protein